MNRTLLLAALHPSPALFETLLRDRAAEYDWGWMIERATAHKVVALLASRVVLGGLEALLPSAAMHELAEVRKRAADHNQLALRALQGTGRCLAEAGVPFMLVKGSVLSEQVYDEPAQRHFFDIDLLVHEEHVDAAEEALSGLGYELWGAERFLGVQLAGDVERALAERVVRRAQRRFYHELSLVTRDKSLLPIDLHWQLLPPGRVRISAADLWKYRVRTEVGGMEVVTLEPEASVVHLAVHALSNRPWSFRLLHLVDLAWALARLRLDTGRLQVVAREWGAQAELARAVAVVQTTLGVALPADVVSAAGPVTGRRKLERVMSAEQLVDRRAAIAPGRWEQVREDFAWGWTLRTFRSTATLLVGRYLATMEFHLRQRVSGRAWLRQ